MEKYSKGLARLIVVTLLLLGLATYCYAEVTPLSGKSISLPARANASAPSWVENTFNPLSTDNNGNLRVNIQGNSARIGNVSNYYYTSLTASVQAINFTGSTQIKVYGISVTQHSGTAGTVYLSYGTGTTCGTGQNNFLTISLSNNTNIFPVSLMPYYIIPANNNLCLIISGGATPSVDVTFQYIQE